MDKKVLKEKLINYYLNNQLKFDETSIHNEAEYYQSIKEAVESECIEVLIHNLNYLKNKRLSELAYLITLISQSKKIDTKEKNIMQLTIDEAYEIGGDTLKEYNDILNLLVRKISLEINKQQVLKFNNLEELTKIYRKYYPKEK